MGKTKAVRLSPRFRRAFLFANAKHAGQLRKGTGDPYIAHLMGVTSLVFEAGGDEDMAIAALLHDVVEDCGGMPVLREVRRRFGRRVAGIVDGCTDSYGEPKPPWRQRKENYIRHLKEVNADTRLVSAADKLHNARTILTDYREHGESIWERFQGKRDGTLWYYQSLLREFKRCETNRVVRELERVIKDLEKAAAGHRAKRG
jgi:(p)ppGpp synthase/HD superfamily hydrolase